MLNAHHHHHSRHHAHAGRRAQFHGLGWELQTHPWMWLVIAAILAAIALMFFSQPAM